MRVEDQNLVFNHYLIAQNILVQVYMSSVFISGLICTNDLTQSRDSNRCLPSVHFDVTTNVQIFTSDIHVHTVHIEMEFNSPVGDTTCIDNPELTCSSLIWKVVYIIMLRF
jgi:hypothetical protein